MVKLSRKENFYVTTAIDYASGSPHLGHAYEKVGADVLARWQRNLGKNVFFLTGTDEHGQKIADNAKEAKLEPKKYVDKMAQGFVDLCKLLNVSNDEFIRTTDSKHKKVVQDVLVTCFKKGDIYKGKYVGNYCVGCEKYLGDDELDESGCCPIHKKKVERIEEETYFFKLSKYEKKLLALYEKNQEFISPESKRMEVINRVKEGLRDLSISRPKNRLGWGIEFPKEIDSNHVVYVWFDALFNYISGTLVFENKKEFWPCDVHLIGKDIMWFHCVYWPAFLMSAGFELPKKVFAHGMILDEKGHKMSKSLGNVIDPFKQIEKFGLEEFRFFLMALGSYGEDLSYSERDFVTRINNDLNNDLGNLVSRVHAMAQKYFDGVVPQAEKFTPDDEELEMKLDIFESFDKYMQELRFNMALEVLWTAIRDTNAYVNKVSPWKVEDKKRLGTIINVLISACRQFAFYLSPFMPNKALLLLKQLGFKDSVKDFEVVPQGHKLGEKVNLFSKVEMPKEEVKPKVEVAKKEGFSALNLKVGKIVSCKKHPDSEKLFIEEIDLGEGRLRTIVSGLQKYYTEQEMIGKKVIVLANLKPAKLAGVVSEGMVLVSQSEEDKLGLLISDLDIGSNLKCLDLVADNSAILKKIDMFFEIGIVGKNGKIYLNDTEIKGVGIDRKIDGKVC